MKEFFNFSRTLELSIESVGVISIHHETSLKMIRTSKFFALILNFFLIFFIFEHIGIIFEYIVLELIASVCVY